MDCVGLFFFFFFFEYRIFNLLFAVWFVETFYFEIYFFRVSDIRFIIRIRIRNFGYLKFRIRIRIVKFTIRIVRISEISNIRF
ncbi:hypothetical protein Hanom_Chr15g01366701 [Helianthus anomalus]